MRIVNTKDTSCDVYVGVGSKWNNPFCHIAHSSTKILVSSREDAILCFNLWLTTDEFKDVEPERMQWILENLHTLRGKTLGDCSHPLPSHAGILQKLADEWAQ